MAWRTVSRPRTRSHGPPLDSGKGAAHRAPSGTGGRMRTPIVGALVCAALCSLLAAAAEPAADALPAPPPDAEKFVIQSSGGRHGTVWRWRGTDGSDITRESIV